MQGVPIKFKAKAKRGGYVCGVPSADDEGVIRFLIVDIFDINVTHHKRVEIFPDTLQQLIGYDHYNKEVYEGDMLAEYYFDLPDTPKRKGRPKKERIFIPQPVYTLAECCPDTPKRKDRPKNERVFIPNLHCNLDLDDYVNVTDDYERKVDV